MYLPEFLKWVGTYAYDNKSASDVMPESGRSKAEVNMARENWGFPHLNTHDHIPFLHNYRIDLTWFA